MSGETKQVIHGPAGALEARVQLQGSSCGLLMCHPHPLFSGTMDNKVVTTVTRAARDLGLSTLRFNFRGVGESEGQHDNGRGEVEDVLAAVRFAQEELGWDKVILAGFSFGAGMACLAAPYVAESLLGLILIAPAVHHFDAPNSLPYEFETWVLMGEEDEVVPFDEVSDWVERVVPQPHWHTFRDTGHFFHGRLGDLRDSIKEELSGFIR